MANYIAVTNKLAKGILAGAVYASVLGNKLSWKNNDEFKGTVEKIGKTITIRKPVLGTTRRNSMTYAPNDVYEPRITLTIDQIFGADSLFTQEEWTLYINQKNDLSGFIKRFLLPHAAIMGNQIDAYIHSGIMERAYQTVGQYGTAVSNQTFTAAKSILQKVGCPDTGIFCVLTPDANAALVNAQISLFNPNGEISSIYRKGYVSTFIGVDMYVTAISPEREDGTAMVGVTPTITSVSAAAVATSGIFAETSTISVNGLVAGGTLTKGTVFSLSGASGKAKSLNMTTKDRTNLDQLFVITEDVASTTSAAQSITVSPAIITSGAYANMYIPAGTLSVIKYSDVSSTRGSESLMLHPDSVQLVSPDLTVPQMVEDSDANIGAMVQDPQTGMKARFARWWNGNDSSWNNRIDCFLGMKVSNPENIVRIRC